VPQRDGDGATGAGAGAGGAAAAGGGDESQDMMSEHDSGMEVDVDMEVSGKQSILFLTNVITLLIYMAYDCILLLVAHSTVHWLHRRWQSGRGGVPSSTL
jgi:hypothetical protein